MNAQLYLECATVGNVRTPPGATCAPVRGDTSPAQTAPDVSVRLFHPQKHMCSRVLAILGCIIVLE